MSERTKWSVGVVIPASDEEATIGACIESVQRSLQAAPSIARVWIVVVADSCTDRTADIAAAALGSEGEVLSMNLRAAGAARRAGVARALRHLSAVDADRLWLANTDADTLVSEDWISVQLALADRGAAGVAGIVRLAEDGCRSAHEVFQATYLTLPDGSHTHVHGANLALRADAYTDVGGWSDLPLAEDHCLWSRLMSRGWQVMSSVRSVVTTSARLQGRAPGGFADTLRYQVEALHGGA